MKKYKIIENGIEYDIQEYSNGDKHGDKHWFLNGYICRAEHSNGCKAWYKNNKLHREDGPAVIFKSGTKEYWLNGKWYPDISSDEELLLASIIT
jgi:hypothetical protein